MLKPGLIGRNGSGLDACCMHVQSTLLLMSVRTQELGRPISSEVSNNRACNGGACNGGCKVRLRPARHNCCNGSPVVGKGTGAVARELTGVGESTVTAMCLNE